MSTLIKIPLDKNSNIYIETCDIQTSEVDPMFIPASNSKVLEKSKEYLDEVLDQIKTFSSGVSDSMKNIADEVEVEFSVKIGADSGIIIASVNTEACISVKLKWEKKKEV